MPAMNVLQRVLRAGALASVLGLAWPSLAGAQELKIGHVNFERLAREYQPLSRTAQTRIEADFARREKELLEQGNRLNEMRERYDREAGSLSEVERTRRQKELSDRHRDYERKRREWMEDVNLRRNEDYAQFLERAQKAVKVVAEQERLDLVLQGVLYASPRVDVTDKVLKVLNAGTGK